MHFIVFLLFFPANVLLVRRKAPESFIPDFTIPSHTTDLPSLKSFDTYHYRLRSYLINTLELDQIPYEDYCEFCIDSEDSVYLPRGYFGRGRLPKIAAIAKTEQTVEKKETP